MTEQVPCISLLAADGEVARVITDWRDRLLQRAHNAIDHHWIDKPTDDFTDEDNRCERCCGEGFVEYNDAPDTWGEDCPSEVNHLVRCPDCRGTGEQRRPNATAHVRDRSEAEGT